MSERLKTRLIYTAKMAFGGVALGACLGVSGQAAYDYCAVPVINAVEGGHGLHEVHSTAADVELAVAMAGTLAIAGSISPEPYRRSRG